MKCPGCGHASFDLRETCKQCGAPMVASATYDLSAATPLPEPEAGGEMRLPADLQFLRLDGDPGGAAPARSGAVRRRLPRAARGERNRTNARVEEVPSLEDAFQVAEEDFEAPAAGGIAASADRDEGPAFFIEEELFPERPAADGAARPAFGSPGGDELRLPAFCAADGSSLLDEVEDSGREEGPIIDRDEEVPERFWAPEVAGLVRRGLALLLDQALLGGLLGVFFLGACAALQLSGFETAALFSSAGLQAALPPFALLAALLSLGYHVFFHGRDGRTPGKALVGVEIRTRDGAIPSLGRCIVRWFAAALGLCCAGAGIAWALFHPRRRGWADLLSATLVAECRRADPGASHRR